MRKIIIIALVCSVSSAVYSQDDLINRLENLAIEKENLKKQNNYIIKSLQDSISSLSSANTAELSKLKDQIKQFEKEKKVLNKELEFFEKENQNLNKNKVKKERDDLLKELNQLKISVANWEQKYKEKEQQIAKEKKRCDDDLKVENAKGRNEILSKIVNTYQKNSFDYLINNSTKLSVQRDMQLIGKNEEVKEILLDLEKYFIAKELLSQKYELTKIKNAETELNHIKRQSTALDKLKENVKYYKDFSDELKNTIDKLFSLDKSLQTAGEEDNQRWKFDKIMFELSGYMYNYDSYGNYPYLSEIVLEIISRKKLNADTDITDLLMKLQ